MPLPHTIRFRRGCKVAAALIFAAFIYAAPLVSPQRSDAQTDPRTLDPAIHLKKARRLTTLKRYKEALQEVNKALTGNAHYWEAWYQGAYIYQLQGRRKEAIAKYKRLLDLKPDYLEARINLGSLLRHDGKFQEAAEQYKKVIETNYYNFDAHYNLANILVDQDLLEDAVKELKLCIKLSPSNASAHNNLGVIFQRNHYPDEAAQEFRQATNLDPANKRFQDNLEMVRKELQQKSPTTPNRIKNNQMKIGNLEAANQLIISLLPTQPANR